MFKVVESVCEGRGMVRKGLRRSFLSAMGGWNEEVVSWHGSVGVHGESVPRVEGWGGENLRTVLGSWGGGVGGGKGEGVGIPV